METKPITRVVALVVAGFFGYLFAECIIWWPHVEIEPTVAFAGCGVFFLGIAGRWWGWLSCFLSTQEQ